MSPSERRTEGIEFDAHRASPTVEVISWGASGTQIASIGENSNLVYVWEASSGRRICKQKHAAIVTCAAFSSTHEAVASGDRSALVHVWRARRRLFGSSDSSPVLYSGHQYTRESPGISCLAWSPDGTQILSGTSGQLTNSGRTAYLGAT
jgi:WD40 repeat protein